MIAFLAYFLVITGIYSLLSLSLNFEYGVSGLVNMAQAAFFMVGAYSSAILVLIFHCPIWLGFLLSIAAGGFLGALMALPVGKLRQHYWAIATLAAGAILRLIFLNTPIQGSYIGASYGIPGIPQPFRSHFTSVQYDWVYLGMVAVWLMIVYVFLHLLINSPYGRLLKALREGDNISLALGKEVRGAKVWAMVIGGGVAGSAGSLYAHYNAFIAPNYFLPLETFLVWGMVIIGGSGNLTGALVGTLLVEAVYNSTRFLGSSLPGDQTVWAAARMCVIGVAMIVVLLYRPAGLLAEKRKKYRRKNEAVS